MGVWQVLQLDFLKGDRPIVDSTQEVVPTTATAIAEAITTAVAGNNSAYAAGLLDSNTTSDFVLKRLFKKLANAIAMQFAETDLPDRPMSSLIAYLISPFALLCMGMAIILNRTVVFATTRRPSELPFMYRLLLRSIAVYSLASQTLPLLRSLKCTSSWAADYIPLTVSPDKCPKPSILWDLYRGICIGHFIETFCSVVQGKMPYSETGMTLFEYSVAFQEVQSSQNLEQEILVASLISAVSQLAVHIQGIFNSTRYRLIPSTIFGISFLSYFGYAVFHGRLLYFPSVCVIGYLPQLAIIIVVCICGAIYGLACLFVGPANMQTSVRAVHIEMSDDFYSSLMKLGVLALTSVTKATYLTEASSISAPLATWIEYIDREDKTSPLSPYLNEVSGPPVDRPEIAPRGFLTINRLVSAFEMVQVLGSLALYAVWTGFKKLMYGVFGRIWPGYQYKKQVQQDQIAGLENKVIYADLDNDYEQAYMKLLSGDILPDVDNSMDYIPSDDEEEDEYEYESNYTSEAEDDLREEGYQEGLRRRYNFEPLSTLRSVRAGSPAAATPRVTTTTRQTISPINDLVEYLLSLFTPQNNDQEEESKILSAHLSSGRITRSKYRRKDDANEIMKVIMERRKENLSPELRQSLCVVCHASPRQVVLWPCRCFALCEDCRMALAVKHFKGCVCCRREVSSFSRVFVP